MEGQQVPRVCFVSKYLYPHDTRLRQQVETLASNAIEVDVICLRDQSQVEHEQIGSITIHRILRERPKDSFGKYLLFTLHFGLRAFFHLLSRFSYDLVVIHTMPEFLVFSALPQRLAGKRLVLDIRDLSAELYRSRWGSGLGRTLLPAVLVLEKLSCWFAHAVITASHGFRDKLIQRGVPRRKITLLLNTADPQIFQYNDKRQFEVIRSGAKLFYHGTVAKRFGVDVAVKALAILQSRIPNSELHIYGMYDSDTRQELEKRAKQDHVTDRLFLHQRRALEEISRLTAEFDLAVVPYRDDSFMQLAGSTKMYEYVAAGLPVVASRLPPAQYIFDDSCIAYAEPENAQDFADKIAEACHDPESRRARAQRAHVAYAQVAGNKTAEAFRALIESLLEPRMASRPDRTRVTMLVLSQYPNDPRVRRQAEALGRAGIHVDIVCLRGSNEQHVERFGLVTAHRVLSARTKETVRRYLFVTLAFLFVGSLTLHKLSRRRETRLLQVHNMPDYLVFAGLRFKLFHGQPVVLDMHDLSPELFATKSAGLTRWYLLPIVRFVERLSCGFATHVITTSQGFARRLMERGVPQEKLTIVLNTADHHIFQQVSRQFRPIAGNARLLYHWTVSHRFGLHVIIDAVALLQDRIPGTALEIYGKYDSSYTIELEEQVKKLGLEHLVVFGDWLSLEEVARQIRGADLGIVPYLSDCFMDIALSTKAFEYIAMGLPVVASRLSSMTAIFTEHEVAYFTPGDPISLANATADLCSDPRRQQTQAAKATKRYEPIGWRVMERVYIDLIKQQIGNP